jgi:peptidoglycan/LPS O-acetylase OafA/YrhL
MNTRSAGANPIANPGQCFKPPKHLPALDGVRGLAILLVLAHNLNLLEGNPSGPLRAVSLAMDLGWIGVQLFFVLSGFLITGILLDTRKADNYWRAFLGRRALRILPLYYATLFAAFVVAPLLGHPAPGAEHQAWLWAYLANWAHPFGRTVSILPHFWSLSVEEQFYLLWPFAVYYLSPRTLGALCAALAGVALISRVMLRASEWSGAADAAYTFTLCRVDALVLGAAAALASRSSRALAVLGGRLPLLRYGALALLVLTVVITRGAPRAGILTQVYGYSLFAVSFTALVLDAAIATGTDPLVRALSFPPLRAVGRYSYAMYVLHSPLHLLVGLRCVARVTEGAAPGLGLAIGYFVLSTAATFVAAVASYYLLEKHFLALKDRIVPRTARS